MALAVVAVRAEEADDAVATPATPGDTTTPAAPAAAPAHAGHRLRAAEAPWPLKPSGTPTRLWCFEETSPGPLLRVKRGQELVVTLDNRIAQPTSLHWQGMRIANALDGVAGLTGEALPPGESRTITFTPRDAGTFWYRPFVPATAAEQTERGLYGVLVVDEDQPPEVDADVVVVLDDWALMDDDQIRPSFGTAADAGSVGRLGNWLTVNSNQGPEAFTVAPGGRLRLRLVNAANARPISLRFEGLNVAVIALDSQPAEPFTPARDSLALLPGNRADLLIRCPAEAGATGTVLAALGPGLPLITIKTEGEASPLQDKAPAALPPPLPGNHLPESIDLAAALRAALVLEGGVTAGAAAPADATRLWRINGVAWPDARKPLFSVGQGKPVVLTLANKSEQLQALHLHGHTARLLHALDDGWEPYWLDTIAIPAGRTVRIAFITEGPGQWAISSAILDRIGAGLMAWFTVT